MTVATESNPLREGLRLERTPEPSTVVIFGASGDLTRRKLMPALYNLAHERLLPGGFSIVGIAKSEMNDDGFRAAMRTALETFSAGAPVEAGTWESFARGLRYLSEDFRDAGGYKKLQALLAELDRERGTCCNRIFYLATPPSFFTDIIRQLGAAGLARVDHGWTRIIIEKPLGRDLKTAQALNRELAEVFGEDQVYRIDHYLGKETVQNILAFRFVNGIFEPIWNRRYVDHVQITAAETVGVEGRATFYEEAGAVRDVIQNHMLQLLALTAMEPPIALDADSVRSEKVKVLRAIRRPSRDQVDQFAVRGQYADGWVDGERIVGYRKERGVRPDSNTETYAAVKFLIDNWRWAEVPFYLRTGKRLPKRVTEIAIQFKQPPLLLFRRTPSSQIEPNLLTLRIQPNEGTSLKFGVKLPGPALQIRQVYMDFDYAASFGVELAEAYERLLLDCMLGDATLFARRDGVEAAWSLLEPLLEAWESTAARGFPNYEAGSWGPREADEFLHRDGRRWRRL